MRRLRVWTWTWSCCSNRSFATLASSFLGRCPIVIWLASHRPWTHRIQQYKVFPSWSPFFIEYPNLLDAGLCPLVLLGFEKLYKGTCQFYTFALTHPFSFHQMLASCRRRDQRGRARHQRKSWLFFWSLGKQGWREMKEDTGGNWWGHLPTTHSAVSFLTVMLTYLPYTFIEESKAIFHQRYVFDFEYTVWPVRSSFQRYWSFDLCISNTFQSIMSCEVLCLFHMTLRRPSGDLKSAKISPDHAWYSPFLLTTCTHWNINGPTHQPFLSPTTRITM